MSYSKSNLGNNNYLIPQNQTNVKVNNQSNFINNTSLKKTKSPLEKKSESKVGFFIHNQIQIGDNFSSFIKKESECCDNIGYQNNQNKQSYFKSFTTNKPNPQISNTFVSSEHHQLSSSFQNKFIPNKEYNTEDHSISLFLLRNKTQTKEETKYQHDNLHSIQHPRLIDIEEGEEKESLSKCSKIDKYSKSVIDSLLKSCLFTKPKQNFSEFLKQKTNMSLSLADDRKKPTHFYEPKNAKRMFNNVNQHPFTHINNPNITPVSKLSFNNVFDLIDKEVSETKTANQLNPEFGFYSNVIADKILDAPDLKDDFCINPLDFSSSNILCVALGNKIYLWDAVNNTTELLTSTDAITTSVKWINHSILAVGKGNGSIEIWDALKNKQLRNIKGHTGKVNALNWNDSFLFSGGEDSFVLCFDLKQKDPLVKMLKFDSSDNNEITSIKVNPFNLNNIACSCKNGFILLFDITKNLSLSFNLNVQSMLPTCQPYKYLNQHRGGLRALSFCPFKKNILISGGVDKTLKKWNSENGELICIYPMNSHVYSINWNLFNNEIVTTHGLPKNQISIWKFPQMVEVGNITEHSRRALYSCISGDKTILVTGSAEERLFVWKIFSELQMMEIEGKYNDDNYELNIR